jgi:uncharacterized linocin/CFP29 family protein
MTVANFPALQAGLRPNSYAGALFAHNFNRKQAYQAVRHLQVHSTLRKDEWESLDRIVVDTGKELMVGVMDLRNAPGGLRPVSIATSLAQYNRMSTMPESQLSMNPLTDGIRGRVDFTLAGVPVPFAFNDFQLDIRTLTASRLLGDGLDLTQASEAAYQVALAWETLLFNGTPAIGVTDRIGTLNTIYGYTTHPLRNTGLATGDWDDPTNGPMNVINTVQAMKSALRQDRYYGPYWLYINDINWRDVGTVFSTLQTRRVIEILQADPELASVKNSPRLISGDIILVDPKPRSVQWVEGAMIRPVEWDEKGILGTNYRIIGAGAPLIKSTTEGQCGVAHFTHAT